MQYVHEKNACVGLLIKEKSLKRAKAMVLHFIAQEDPAFGRSSIKQKASGADSQPADFELPSMSGAGLATTPLLCFSCPPLS